MTRDLSAGAWRGDEAARALEVLAEEVGGGLGSGSLPAPAELEPGAEWLAAAGLALGVEVQGVLVAYHQVARFVRDTGPALVPVRLAGESRLLAVVHGGSRWAVLLCPDGQRVRVSASAVRDAMAGDLEGTVAGDVDAVLSAAAVAPKRRRTSRQALVAELLAARTVGPCWVVRPRAGAPFLSQVRQSGHLAKAGALLLCHLVHTVLSVLGWWLVGRGLLAGRLSTGWVIGWGLVLLTTVPLRSLVVALEGEVVLGVSGLLKRRLLAGVLALDLETTKHEGVGMLLGRVLQTNAVETLALNGGCRAALALVEVVAAMWVLSRGAGGWSQVVLFGACVGGCLALAWRCWARASSWVETHLAVTHELTEEMVGNRTRLAQLDPLHWHVVEDELLARHLATSKSADAVVPWLSALPVGWRLVGLAGLVAPVVAGATSPASLAVAVGGVLLGGQALASLSSGLGSLALAEIGWRRVKVVFRAAASADPVGRPLPTRAAPSNEPTITLRDVSFCYPGRGRVAVTGATFAVREGDRVLLCGPSGSGKSTLVSLMCGLREPDSGLVLCRGLDLATLGEGRWRRRVAASPQFHSNHVLTETMAFNLLMGRSWPPTAADLLEAEDVCRELGLGGLLDRMPSGLMQMVGDTGWQLSHGERSLLFVARALLQRADLVVLDESLGALDPMSLERAVACVKRRAPALLLVAHA